MPRPIPDDEIGLKVLRDGSNGADGIDIVAIHGMGAHPNDTWCKAVTNGEHTTWINWLDHESMLPAKAPAARIMRYGYHSQWFGGNAVLTKTSSISPKLLYTLKTERKKHPFRPLIFIAHSFGGLVVLRTLVQAFHDNEKWEGISESTVGLIFFGTPFRGTHSALSQGEILQLADEKVHANPTNLRALQASDESLVDLLDTYLMLARHSAMPRIVCFYEGKESDVGAIVGKRDITKVILVDETSGCLDLSSNCEKISRESCDHFEINKFGSPNDQDFKILCGIIEEIAEDGPLLIAQRLGALGITKPRDMEHMRQHRRQDHTKHSMAGPSETTQVDGLALWIPKPLSIKAQLGFNPITFSPDSKLLATASGLRRLQLWDTTTWESLADFPPSDNLDGVDDIRFSCDSNRLGWNHRYANGISIWDVKQGTARSRHVTGDVESAAFSFSSRDPTLVAVASEIGTVMLWDALTGQRGFHLTPLPIRHDSRAKETVAFSHDGTMVASGPFGQSVIVWQVRNGNIKYTLDGHRSRIKNMIFSKADKFLYTMTTHDLILWDMSSGIQVNSRKAPDNMSYLDLQMSPDDSLLGGTLFRDDGCTRTVLRDPRTFEIVDYLGGWSPTSLKGMFVSFSQDSKLLATGDESSTFTLWNVATRRRHQTLKGHTEKVVFATFSPDSKMLVSQSEDGVVKLWGMAQAP